MRSAKIIVFSILVFMIGIGWPPIWQKNGPFNTVGTAHAATETFTTSGQWQAPEGVTSVIVEAWGGGGAGGGRGASSGSSGGGGGGAYASETISVSALSTYNYTVGAAVSGGAGNGTDGNDSYWNDGSQVKAAGGKGGASTTTKGLGGSTSDSVGTTKYGGGDGADGGSTSGGGGGGAGSLGEGGDALLGVGGGGTSNGGGSGGNGVTNANGNPGTEAGGGGAGARRTNGNRSGGGGARGQIKITYSVVAVSISDGSVDYGVLISGSSKDTTSGGLNDTQVATNSGDVDEDFNIKGQNSVDWTLAASAGSEQYIHAFCDSGSGSPDPCDSGPTWTSLTTNYQTLEIVVSPSDTKKFDLKITTPTSTNATAQQTVNVTIQAVEH